MDTYASLPRSGAEQAMQVGGDRPYLNRIENLAEEAERTAEAIQAFIDRCRGGGGPSGAAVTPVPSGHFGQLERLTNAMAEVNKLSRELGTIG